MSSLFCRFWYNTTTNLLRTKLNCEGVERIEHARQDNLLIRRYLRSSKLQVHREIILVFKKLKNYFVKITTMHNIYFACLPVCLLCSEFQKFVSKILVSYAWRIILSPPISQYHLGAYRSWVPAHWPSWARDPCIFRPALRKQQ